MLYLKTIQFNIISSKHVYQKNERSKFYYYVVKTNSKQVPSNYHIIFLCLIYNTISVEFLAHISIVITYFSSKVTNRNRNRNDPQIWHLFLYLSFSLEISFLLREWIIRKILLVLLFYLPFYLFGPIIEWRNTLRKCLEKAGDQMDFC